MLNDQPLPFSRRIIFLLGTPWYNFPLGMEAAPPQPLKPRRRDEHVLPSSQPLLASMESAGQLPPSAQTTAAAAAPSGLEMAALCLVVTPCGSMAMAFRPARVHDISGFRWLWAATHEQDKERNWGKILSFGIFAIDPSGFSYSW